MKNEIPDYAVLFGGTEFQAQVVDHTEKKITVELVKVRTLPVEEFPSAIKILTMEDDNALIEMVCNRESGWSKTLVPQNYLALVDLIKKLNSDFFVYAESRIQSRWNWISTLPPETLRRMAKETEKSSRISSQNSRLHPA